MKKAVYLENLLREISTKFIKKIYRDLKGNIPIIGVGGVDSGESAFEKISAGATALQLYTGMIYKGPSIARDIKKELIQILQQKGFKKYRRSYWFFSKIIYLKNYNFFWGISYRT